MAFSDSIIHQTLSKATQNFEWVFDYKYVFWPKQLKRKKIQQKLFDKRTFKLNEFCLIFVAVIHGRVA